MKRITIIFITIFVYFIALIGLLAGIDQYVHAKDERLRVEMITKLDEIFSGKRKLVDIQYSDNKVEYERIQIPSIPPNFNTHDEKTTEKTMKAISTWESNYGNLTSLYCTYYLEKDRDNIKGAKNGWCLMMMERCDSDVVAFCYVLPYAVGYMRQNDPWLNDIAPSVPDAVNVALKFYTTNDKSEYYDFFEKGSYNRVVKELRNARNEYYKVVKDSIPRRIITNGIPLFDEFSTYKPSYLLQNGFMYYGNCKVFVAITQPITCTIKKIKGEPDKKDRNDLWLYWGIGLTALMLIIVIPLACIQRKHDKEKDESLYEKLKRLCHPGNFISKGNYDKEKIDKANEIYKKLLETSPDDKEALGEIQLQAVIDLGINLINQDKLNELKEKVNPMNYMNPYNAEKVALANELYAILSKDDLTYIELAEVEEKSKKL